MTTKATASRAPGRDKHTASVSPTTDVFQALLEGLNVGIASILPSGVIVYCNARFREILGIPLHASVVGSELKFHLLPSSWPSLNEGLAKALEGPVEGELRLRLAGRTHFVGLSLTPMRVSGTTTIRAVAAEKTELVETSKALDESQAELQSLSAKILQLQDNDRRNIARDLHDVTGQELAFVLMSLGFIESHLHEGTGVRERVRESIDMLHKVENEIRTLSYLLHPPLLDESGLASALQWYVQGLGRRIGLKVHMEIDAPLPRLTRDREIALFRVVQEALTNVFRHAEATTVWIRSAVTSTDLELFVEDDGKGIHAEAASQIRKGRNNGVGIAGMDQRLRQVGGKLLVSSSGRGTTVRACAPIGEVEQPAIETHELHHAPADGAKASPVKRILIADDHEVTRRGIRALLTENVDLEVCGEAADGLEAIAQVFKNRPDLIVLDLTMPGAGGLTVANRLRHEGASTKILIFTTHCYPGLEKTLATAGCHGYVLKQNASQELVFAIREVLRGGTHFRSSSDSRQGAQDAVEH